MALVVDAYLVVFGVEAQSWVVSNECHVDILNLVCFVVHFGDN